MILSSTLLTLTVVCATCVCHAVKVHSSSLQRVLPRPPRYTPLLFFKVPKGRMRASDDMERLVSDVEKELHVNVQRFDVLRDPLAMKLYEQINANVKDGIVPDHKFPLLYHRESRQVVTITDRSLVRAWAKGRYFYRTDHPTSPLTKKGKVPFLPDKPDDDDDVPETMQEEELTDLQRRGKEAIQKRMEDAAAARKK